MSADRPHRAVVDADIARLVARLPAVIRVDSVWHADRLEIVFTWASRDGFIRSARRTIDDRGLALARVSVIASVMRSLLGSMADDPGVPS